LRSSTWFALQQSCGEWYRRNADSGLPLLDADEEPAGIVAASRLELDRLLQHPPDVREEFLHFVISEPIDRPTRIDR
jgi:hypothetical protein